MDTNFRLKRLYFNGFKNLQVMASFETTASGVTVIIGENGSGKSTILEALLCIFASFETPSLYDKRAFMFELEYEMNQRKYNICGERGYVTVEEKVGDEYKHICEGPIKDIPAMLVDLQILPSRIYTMYSGENDRMSKMHINIMKRYKTVFTKRINSMRKSNADGMVDLPERRFWHFENKLIPVYFATTMQDEIASEELKKYCDVDSISEIRFDATFTQNQYNSKKFSSSAEAVKFVKSLDEYHIFSDFCSFGNIKLSEEDNKDFSMVMNLRDSKFNPEEFFAFWNKIAIALTGTFTTKYVSKGLDLDDTCMSQGQRQWIKIMCMTLLSREEGSLVMMDEPDAFMNPKWKYDFSEIVDRIRSEKRACDMLIVTHDPLLVNGLSKDNIRKCVKKKNEILTVIPESDMEGLGMDGILRSSCYELETSYDRNTADKHKRWLLLYTKMINSELLKEEEHELRSLADELGRLPSTYTSVDYLYTDFLSEYFKSEFYYDDYVDKPKVEERKKFISETIKKLYGER